MVGEAVYYVHAVSLEINELAMVWLASYADALWDVWYMTSPKSVCVGSTCVWSPYIESRTKVSSVSPSNLELVLGLEALWRRANPRNLIGSQISFWWLNYLLVKCRPGITKPDICFYSPINTSQQFLQKLTPVFIKNFKMEDRLLAFDITRISVCSVVLP